jgi:hypothetical protein
MIFLAALFVRRSTAARTKRELVFLHLIYYRLSINKKPLAEGKLPQGAKKTFNLRTRTREREP